MLDEFLGFSLIIIHQDFTYLEVFASIHFMQGVENKDEIGLSLNDTKDIDGRIYELGYLLVSTIPIEDVPTNYSNLKDLIISQGGEIISDEMPKEIKLAYTMRKIVQNVRSKFDSAYFGWIKFEIYPEQIIELKKKLDIDVNIIRFLI